MEPPNALNVFKGPDALAQFFDPDRSPPLPLVELPDALNPLRRDGVRIFAKMLTQLPAQNVKSLPGQFRNGTTREKLNLLNDTQHFECSGTKGMHIVKRL